MSTLETDVVKELRGCANEIQIFIIYKKVHVMNMFMHHI